MPFSNPITAGLKLLITAIQSPDFVAGTSGWTINKDGSAEFNDLTIRGTFLGTDFEITSNGVFFYSSAPASGNLVLSLAWVAGTDGFGNGYPSGLSVLNHGGSGASGVVVGYNGIQPLIYFNSPVTNVLNAPALFVNANGAGAAQFGTLVITGDEDKTQTDFIALNFDGSSQDGSHLATMTAAYLDPSSNFHALWTATLAGTTVNGALYAVKPGTGTNRTNALVPESWHPSSMGTGFTTNAADQAPRYRLEGIAGGLCRLDGVAYTSAATAAGARIFTLPAGYPPLQRKRYPAVTNVTTTAGAAVIEVLATGDVLLLPAASSGQQVVLDGITFPID